MATIYDLDTMQKRIVELEAQNKQLRDALEEISDPHNYDNGGMGDRMIIVFDGRPEVMRPSKYATLTLGKLERNE